MVGPPRITLRPARDVCIPPRIDVVIGGKILGTHHLDHTREKFSRLLLLATPQKFFGSVDVDYFVCHRHSKRHQHRSNFGLGEPSDGPQSQSGMGRDYSLSRTQCIGHVRTAPVIDESIGRIGIVALFFLDHIFESKHRCQYECDVGEFFHDFDIVCDMVVLVVDGPFFDVVVVVYGLWSGILFCVDRICRCVVSVTMIMIMIMILVQYNNIVLQ